MAKKKNSFWSVRRDDWFNAWDFKEYDAASKAKKALEERDRENGDYVDGKYELVEIVM